MYAAIHYFRKSLQFFDGRNCRTQDCVAVYVVIDLVCFDVSPANDNDLGAILESNPAKDLKTDFVVPLCMVKKCDVENVTDGDGW